MEPILELFLSEARENLEFLDKNLGELESGDAEVVNALFRAAHTLKGGAGLVGFSAVKEITHAAEDLLDAYRKGEVQFSSELVDTLYDAFDEVVELIDAAEELGSVDVDIEEDRISQIKNEVRSFLNGNDNKEEVNSTVLQNNENEQEEEVNAPFTIDDSLAISQYFSYSQIAKLSTQIPLKSPKVSNSFLENSDSLWLVELDLDSDVLELGNDPIYLFYLLGEDRLKSFAVKVIHCDSLDNNPLEWKSYMVAAISGDANLIEETFYNVIDDLRFAPLSIEKVFDTTYDSEDNNLLEDFKDEFLSIVKNGDFSILSEKLSAITQIINSESKEGFILNLLSVILPNFNIESEEYREIIYLALSKLGWQVEDEKTSEQIEDTPKEDNKEFDLSKQDPKAVANAINILKAQLKVLGVSKDNSVVERTKLLLGNVLGFLGIDEGLAAVNDIDKLRDFIGDKIKLLSPDEEIEKPLPKKEEITKKSETEKVEEDNSIKQENKKEERQKVIEKPTKEHKEQHHQATPKTVKIEQTQIDELMDMVGELLVMKNSLPYIADEIGVKSPEYTKRELLVTYEQINRVTDRLQDRVMGMRLLPLSYIFGRYPKLVRDLSKKLGKKIKYEEEGGETKLDKTVIEKLADPMIHIIRNSLDHGLETEEERVKKGKNPTGTLKISARSEGDKVFLSIEDDGRGIDEQKIVMKALELGVVDSDKVDSMSKEEKLKLLFAPGLSTKEEVTELSGRGVGTDAVKTVIEELGGTIHIESEIDKGTKTVFELPLSVALTNIFHIKMNGVNYAISMDSVVETEKILTEEIKTAAHKPFIKIRGELVPLVFEPILLNRDKPNSDEVCLVVVKNRDKKFGLVVDEFVGQLNVVQKPLGGAFSEHPFITGSSLLGNGEVLFVLDPKKLVNVE